MSHSAECLREQAEREIERQRWLRDWPNHCRNCQGLGGEVFYESHGMPYGSETLFDPCVCTENEKCPRCGAANFDWESCEFCGWKSTRDGLPDHHVCYGICTNEEVPF